MRDDSDYDQEAWLTDIGVEDMMDAERHFGLDWPYMSFSGYGQGDRDVDQVADDFTEGTGFRAKGYSGYHSGSRSDQQQQGYFIIEPDGSIDADEGDAGLEFISPAMPLKDGIEMLKKVQAWAKSEGCYTNKSTGLHMNISVPGMSIESLDYVKLALFLGDEYILKQFGRQYNSYCKSAMSKIKDRIRPEDVPAVLGQVKQNLNSLASKIIHSGITEKYTSINTRGQYVEFRGPGGDYLDRDPLDLVNTALRLAMSLRIATNPEAYKQEYAKKLYKLVEQSPDADDSVELFSQYAMGQINKSELAARLQFAQRSRKIEKTKPQVKRLIDEPGVRDQINKFPGVWRDTFNSLRDKSNEELQELQKNFDDLGEYYYFTKEQGQLALALIANELESRSTQGEKKQYWVTRRDGDGGKQMVYANNENEAILLGGKQMGMKREDSISKLKAELMEKPQDDNAAPESLSQSWKDWVEETLPSVTVDTANSVRQRIINGGDQLSGPASAWIIGQIDRELRSRMDQGVVDGNETRWKVTIARGRPGDENREPVYVDADSPRQAKIKAQVQYFRGQGIDVDIDAMDAVAVTADAGRTEQSWIVLDGFNRPVGTVQARTNDEALRIFGSTNDVDTRNYTATPGAGNTSGMTDTSREVFDSLPEGTRSWLERVGEHHDLELRQALDHIEEGRGRGIGSGLYSNQVAFVKTAIETELRRRSNNAALATNAGNAENAVRESLPQHWQDFLTNDLSYSANMHLINMLRNLSRSTASSDLRLSDQQLAYIRVQIRRQLRANGINPDDEVPAEQPVDLTSPDDETIDDLMGGGDEEETPVDVAGAIQRANDNSRREREEIAQNAAQAQSAEPEYRSYTFQNERGERRSALGFNANAAMNQARSMYPETFANSIEEV